MKVIEGKLTGNGIKVGIVAARFNEFIVNKLVSGAEDALIRHGVNTDDIEIAWVPGSFEIPIIAKKMATSGALFDMEKLLNISRNYLASIKATDVFERTLTWAKVYDKDFATILESNKEMITNFLNIERESNKPRKDFGKYSEVKEALSYMYELPTNYEWANITDKEEIKNILNTYINNYYDESDDNETWFNKLKEMCDNLGYASNMKEHKQNPEAFKGNVADVSTVIRVALTGRTKTPNLTDIMHILGLEEIKRRIAMI